MHSLKKLAPRCRYLVFKQSYCKPVPQLTTEKNNTITRNDNTIVKNISPLNSEESSKNSFELSKASLSVKNALKNLNISVSEQILREKKLTDQTEDKTSIHPETSFTNEVTIRTKRPDVPEEVIKPSYNFASYVNHSESLQQLLNLGVDLSYWETLRDVPEIVLRKDFDRDFKPYIQFLVDKGVPADALGKFFTKNPYILTESLENLQIRINYFESKKFTPEAIAYMIHKYPLLLNQKTSNVDQRLGFYQKELQLTGDEVRNAVTGQARLLTADFFKIKQMHYTIEREFGFLLPERKSLFIGKPKLWTASRSHVQERFNYVHNIMAISHEVISRFPEVLMSRLFRLKERHLFLKSLKRDQYDPTKENYISLKELVGHNDIDFCTNVARTAVSHFNNFLKTL